jgi:hypothetical protein
MRLFRLPQGRECFIHYMPYTEENKKLGMVCTSIGNIEVPPNTLYPLNKNAHPIESLEVAEGRTLS